MIQRCLTNKRSICYAIFCSHSRVHNWISEMKHKAAVERDCGCTAPVAESASGAEKAGIEGFWVSEPVHSFIKDRARDYLPLIWCAVYWLFLSLQPPFTKSLQKFFRANGKKVPSWLLRGLINEPSRCLPIEGQIENWMTVRMGYDSATTSPMGASRTTLRWDSGAGTEKRHSEKTANNLQIFQETVPFYTRDFSYLWGKLFYGQDRRFSQSSFCRNAGRPPHRLRRFY